MASSPSTGYVTPRQGTRMLTEQLFTARVLCTRREVKEAHTLPRALGGSLRGVNRMWGGGHWMGSEGGLGRG